MFPPFVVKLFTKGREMKDTHTYTDIVALDWKDSAYYDLHENEAAMALFWGESSPFLRMFRQLDLTNVVEIGCGHGRHVPKYAEQAGEICIVDVNKTNVDYCAKRFSTWKKPLRIIQNNGSDLKPINSQESTAVFSYDAMVHFELSDVISYLSESFRVLSPGGKALFHHSNFDGAPGLLGHRIAEFGWRNFMNAKIFCHVAMRTGFIVLEQTIIEWGGIPNLDCISLLQKPKTPNR
jgi:SAM-dependent methyltransferase